MTQQETILQQVRNNDDCIHLPLGMFVTTIYLQVIFIALLIHNLCPVMFNELCGSIEGIALYNIVSITGIYAVMTIVIQIIYRIKLSRMLRGHISYDDAVRRLLTHYYIDISLKGQSLIVLERSVHEVSIVGHLMHTFTSNMLVFILCALGLPHQYNIYEDYVKDSIRIAASSYDEEKARVFDIGGQELIMVYVQGGAYTMKYSDTGHTLQVEAYTKVSDFYIGRTEVTKGLWDAVMGTSSYGASDHPKTDVSWYECQEFVRRLNDMTGEHFRLPTAAEWEWAARGGVKSKGYEYCGSNDADSVAWYDKESTKGVYEHTYANELGLFDMMGNVHEWLLDTAPLNTQRHRIVNPVAEDDKDTTKATNCGGSYCEDVHHMDITTRYVRGKDKQFCDVGLRLVLSEITEDKLTHVPTTAIGVLGQVYSDDAQRQTTPRFSGGWMSTMGDSIIKNYRYSYDDERNMMVCRGDTFYLMPPRDKPLKMRQIIWLSDKTFTEQVVGIDGKTVVAEKEKPKGVKVTMQDVVDLGLSVKWHSRNMGAESPFEHGGLYTWKEARKGGRLPSMDEMKELTTKCKWTWNEVNGVGGYVIVGPNGRSIFLPFSGKMKHDEKVFENERAYYWSGTTDDIHKGQAMHWQMSEDRKRYVFVSPDEQMSVRFVSK